MVELGGVLQGFLFVDAQCRAEVAPADLVLEQWLPDLEGVCLYWRSGHIAFGGVQTRLLLPLALEARHQVRKYQEGTDAASQGQWAIATW